MSREISKYEDIISHEHHVSRTHPQMSLHDRAAQFAPFAALTGHSNAIEKTGRQVEEAVEQGALIPRNKFLVKDSNQ